MIYQSIYGHPEIATQRDCEARFHPIKELCDKFNREFTVFDLGCNVGYFGFRIREEFPSSVYIGLDDKLPFGKLLQENLRLSAQMIWLKHRITMDQLDRLASCETFDVVLALAVLHHFEDPVRALKACRNMGRYTLLEVPGAADKNALNADNLAGLRAALEKEKVIWTCDSHVTDGAERQWYLLENSEFFEWQYHDAPEKNQKIADYKSRYKIISDWDEKRIEIERTLTINLKLVGDSETVAKTAPEHIRVLEKRGFHPGMNMWNAQWLNCAWPKELKQRGLRVAEQYRDIMEDWVPWNFIVSGQRIVPIDYGNKRAWAIDEMLDAAHPDDVHIVKKLEKMLYANV